MASNLDQQIRTTSRQAVVALAFLGVALVASAALVVDLVHGDRWALAASVGLGLLVAVVWFGLPLSRRVRAGNGAPET
jgi:hypothetical protein